MRITKLRIRHFRSIQDLTVEPSRFGVLCGPNSCGKSNVFRAIALAFETGLTIADAQSNLPAHMLVGQGGPGLSIWVHAWFVDVPADLKVIAAQPAAQTIEYKFQLTRTGKVKRTLGASAALTDEQFERVLDFFQPLYVPPIRDLAGDGLAPFKFLMREALTRKRATNVRRVNESAKTLVQQQANLLLKKQAGLTKNLLRAKKLDIDCSPDVQELLGKFTLTVHYADNSVSQLSALGTGHQSAVILHLYRQLGESLSPKSILYMFEEPDNHLHPSTIRAICDDLRGISTTSQVLVSTHSPIFISHAGFNSLINLHQDGAGSTQRRNARLALQYTEKQALHYLEQFGLRLTEPLLTRRVIVVEGAADKVVLSRLCELRSGASPDEREMLVVAAGGKGNAVTLCTLLNALDVDWCCLLDEDGLYSGEVPFSRRGLTPQQVIDARAAIALLKTSLDGKARRGANTIKTLDAVDAELGGAVPQPQAFDGSPVDKILKATQKLPAAVQAQVKADVMAKKRSAYLKALAANGVYVWSGAIEDALLRTPAAEACVENELVAMQEIPNALPAGTRRSQLVAKLHGYANEPAVLGHLVEALHVGSHLKRSSVVECYTLLFE